MSDRMHVLPFRDLMRWILDEYEQNQSIFGIHRSLFFIPRAQSPCAIPDLFGGYLATPIGPASTR